MRILTSNYFFVAILQDLNISEEKSLCRQFSKTQKEKNIGEDGLSISIIQS